MGGPGMIAVVCFLLLVVMCSCPSTASGMPINTLLLEEFGSGTWSTVKLLHRDHATSPLRDTNSTTVADRIPKAVTRSHARTQRLGLLSRSNETFRKASYLPAVEARVSAAAGEYVMTFSLGTPPVNFMAIVDTGSDLVWLQCKPCIACLNQSDSLFDLTKSASFKKLSCSNQFCKDLPQSNCTAGCSYFYNYGDGSYTSGLLASETTSWTTRQGSVRSLTDLAFGCGFDNEGDFAGADGLLGFGRGPLSLPSQMKSFVGKGFSYCLGDFLHATNQSSFLTLGIDLRIDSSRLKFTPLISNDFFPTFYYVQIKSIKVGSKRLNIHPDTFSLDSMGNGGTIVDSGTTLTYLPQPAYDAILSRLLAIVAYPVVHGTGTSPIGLDLCFNVSRIPLPEFPTIAFHFTGVTVRLPMQNTFITFDLDGTSLSCLAMAAAGPGGFGIFGNYQQQNLHVFYDLDRSRLGFKEQKCL